MDHAEPRSREEIGRLRRQQTVLARFGELALESEDLDEILTEACRLVGGALGTDLAKVVELQEDGQTLLVRAGVGWKPGVVGVATLRLGERSSEGYALKTGEATASPDIDRETRFHYPAFLTDNGVRALVNVPIIGSRGRAPFGILQVDSRQPREFDETDVQFLRGYANLIAAAVARLRSLGEMQGKNAELDRSLAECQGAGQRQVFLAQELDHRAKNMLSVVQAVVRLTKAKGHASFLQVVEGRIAALARAQTLLSADRWSGADLHTLLRGELAPFLNDQGSGPQAELEGPVLALPPGAAQPFSMAVHELATNAVKYGALSNAKGRLRITWTIVEGAANRTMRFHWAEMGGPPVDGPPNRPGFGSRVLTSTLRGQLGGTLVMAWEPTGLVCDVTLPLGGAQLATGLAKQVWHPGWGPGPGGFPAGRS